MTYVIVFNPEKGLIGRADPSVTDILYRLP